MTVTPFSGPTSKTFISQRLRLHYLDWGNADAPDLVLLHGGQDHAHNWDWVARELRADWHVIAPDLRGHGDSAWSMDGTYTLAAYIYDLTQLIQQRTRPPVTLVGHSLGGVIALRYAGLYPDTVSRLVSIEGLSVTPNVPIGAPSQPIADRLRAWIDNHRRLAGQLPRRYPALADAYARMRQNNRHLSDEQVRHLTEHAVLQNEDGSYSWKFDDYTRKAVFMDLSKSEECELHQAVACPVLLMRGADSWLPDPRQDGTAALFRDVRVDAFEGAGHWIHHDRTDAFLTSLRKFI